MCVDSESSGSESDCGDSNNQKRRSYRSYSLQFRKHVVSKLGLGVCSIGDLAEIYNIPRTTIFTLEKQLARQSNDSAHSIHKKGKHLKSGSGRHLSYPKQVDEELSKWILERRDVHLPVGLEMVKAKVRSTILPHNQDFLESNGSIQKFKRRNGFSMRCKTSVSQKLPAEFERKIESFLTEVRALRARHQNPFELVLNMDETPVFFDMIPGRTIAKKESKEICVRST